MKELSNGLDAVRRRLRQGLAWNTVATAATNGAVFLSGLLVANTLVRADYGRFSLVRSTLLTIAAVAPLATGLVAMKFMAELRDTDRTRAGRILGLCLLISVGSGLLATVGLVVAAPAVASDYLKAPELATLLRLAAAGVVLQILVSFFVSLLTGAEAYRALAKASAAAGAFSLLVIPGAAWLFGLSAAAGALAVSAAVQVLLLSRASNSELRRRGIRLTLQGLGGETRLLGTFFLPAAVAGFTAMPAQWLASSFLARQPDGFGELALFSAGLTLRNLVLVLPGVVSSVGAAVLNAERGRKDVAGSRAAFLGTLRTTTVVAAAAGLPIILLARPLLRLFGSSFVVGAPALRLLVVSAVLEAVAIVIYQIPVAAGRMWTLLVLVIVPRDLALALLGWTLTPAHGAAGLGIAWMTAQFLAVGLGILCAILVLRAESTAQSGKSAS